MSKAASQSILHEPLLHFIVIGGLLFLFTFLKSGGTADTGHQIHVNSAELAVLRSGFERDNGRTPDDAELQELIDGFVRTEVCVREARAVGLDRDDQLIRDHLRSKYEMLLDDGSQPPDPTDEQLQAYLAAHPDRYRTEDSVRFMQIYLDPLARGTETELDAHLLLEQLSGEENPGTVQALSDPGPLPASLPLVAISEVGWQFDTDFADAVAVLPVGQWGGPVESSYGLHLVLVQEHLSGRPLELAEIREDVERDWIYDQLQARLDERMAEVLKQYTVTVDELPLASAAPEAGQ